MIGCKVGEFPEVVASTSVFELSMDVETFIAGDIRLLTRARFTFRNAIVH